MTIKQLINEQGIDYFFKLFGWQGGTIHQVEQEIKRKLASHGVVEHKDTKELIQIIVNQHKNDEKGQMISNYMATKYPNVI